MLHTVQCPYCMVLMQLGAILLLIRIAGPSVKIATCSLRDSIVVLQLCTFTGTWDRLYLVPWLSYCCMYPCPATAVPRPCVHACRAVAACIPLLGYCRTCGIMLLLVYLYCCWYLCWVIAAGIYPCHVYPCQDIVAGTLLPGYCCWYPCRAIACCW